MIKELIEYLVTQIVEQTEQVEIVASREGSRTTFLIKVSDLDRGKVIGRQGQTIKAIRTLVNLFVPEDKKVLIDVAK